MYYSVNPNYKDLYLIHLDNPTIGEKFAKMNLYTDYEIQSRRHKKYGRAKFILRPTWFFLRSYFIHGGWRDGIRGLMKAYFSMIHQVMLMSKLEEEKLNANTK